MNLVIKANPFHLPCLLLHTVLFQILALKLVAADHYQTLGVPRAASNKEIKAAYRKITSSYLRDGSPRGASAEQKSLSKRIFEAANTAFDVLGDPSQRRQYDEELVNPRRRTDESAEGPPPRPLVGVKVVCTLEELAGWRAVEVNLRSLRSSLGASLTRPIAAQFKDSPLRFFLRPGTKDGDVVRKTFNQLGQNGIDIDFQLYAKPHLRWQREGPMLTTNVTLPAWHSFFGLPLRVRGVDGRMLSRSRSLEDFEEGDTVHFANQGMPIPSVGKDAYNATRGHLHVLVDVRNPFREFLRTLAYIAGAASMFVLSRAASALLLKTLAFMLEQLFAAIQQCREEWRLQQAKLKAEKLREARARRLAKVRAAILDPVWLCAGGGWSLLILADFLQKLK